MLLDLDSKLAASTDEDEKAELVAAVQRRETTVIGVYRQVRDFDSRLGLRIRMSVPQKTYEDSAPWAELEVLPVDRTLRFCPQQYAYIT